MIFWVVIGGMVLVAAAMIGAGYARAQGKVDATSDFDLRVYRDQLAEVDRDLSRGVLSQEDAERTRTEIGRRILAADAARDVTASSGPAGGRTALFVGLSSLVLAACSLGLYLWLGVPGYGDLALEDRIALAEEARQSRPSQAAAEEELFQSMREDAARAADDAERLTMITNAERALKNVVARHEALGGDLRAAGDAATSDDLAGYAQLLILATGQGYVSPEAEWALQAALQKDPQNGIARYYWGLMRAQTGRPDIAFRLWDALLREGPPDAPWIEPIQAQIDEAALRAGVNYVQPPPGTGRGPNAADIAAAEDMSAAERMEMVQGMVASLGERLATEGGTPSEWAQLIQALGVLGRTEDAFAIYNNALEVFADEPDALDTINRAGDRAGIAN